MALPTDRVEERERAARPACLAAKRPINQGDWISLRELRGLIEELSFEPPRKPERAIADFNSEEAEARAKDGGAKLKACAIELGRAKELSARREVGRTEKSQPDGALLQRGRGLEACCE